ncbi:MAG: LLM class flavin-dependent oxidoreductase [Candidatus Bathyarchaeia archaeon]
MVKKEVGIGFVDGAPLSETVSYAALAEKRGFGSCWVTEDYFYRGAFSLASACAANTKKMRLGIGTVNPYTRHPALIAMEAAAFDEVSNGRFVLGIGASIRYWIEHQMGLKYSKQLASLRDCVEIVRKMFMSGKVEHSGEAFKLRNSSLLFKPLRSRIPIYIGAMGPKMLQLCGEIGDGVILSILTSVPYTKYALENLRIGAQRAGRKLTDFEVVAYLPLSVSKKSAEAKKAIKPILGVYIAEIGVHPLTVEAGMKEEQIEPLKKAFPHGDKLAKLVTDELVDTFAVAGTPDECIDRLKAYRAAGVDVLVGVQPPRPKEMIDLVGKEVIPHLKK